MNTSEPDRWTVSEGDTGEATAEVDRQNRDVVAVAAVSTHRSDFGWHCQWAATQITLMFIHFPAEAIYKPSVWKMQHNGILDGKEAFTR